MNKKAFRFVLLIVVILMAIAGFVGLCSRKIKTHQKSV